MLRKRNSPVRLLLVRHGITRLHTGDRFWGSTDIALSNAGIKQAGQLRNRLSQEKLSAIYSSPLRRARSTAEIIAAGHKVEVTPCDDLCECNFGYIEGLTFEEIKQLADGNKAFVEYMKKRRPDLVTRALELHGKK